MLDRRAQKVIKLSVPSVENLANLECVRLVISCLCKESNEDFNNYFKLIEHKYKNRNNLKRIKLPPVKALFGNPSRDGVLIKILVWRHLKPNPQLL